MIEQSRSGVSIELEFVGVVYRITSVNAACLRILASNFEALIVNASQRAAANTFEVLESSSGGYVVRSIHDQTTHVNSLYELLYLIEKSITVATQVERADLFFLHAAAVEYNGFAYILTAPSGSGKSSTAWALLNRGFGYLSDELAPIDPDSLQVSPYPHALCLKRELPAPFDLPKKVIVTEHTFHLHTSQFPRVVNRPLPLGGIFLVQFDDRRELPQVQSISAGEAAAGIYINGLNQLAHQSLGLEAVARITTRVPACRVSTAGLEASCAVLRATVERIEKQRNSL